MYIPWSSLFIFDVFLVAAKRFNEISKGKFGFMATIRQGKRCAAVTLFANIVMNLHTPKYLELSDL